MPLSVGTLLDTRPLDFIRAALYLYRMARTKDAGISSTNQPQGGWHPPVRPLNMKEAAAAMQSGNFDGVIKMLRLGIHPDEIHTEQDMCALMACLSNDATQVADRLLKAGAHPDRNPQNSQDMTYLGCLLSRQDPGFNQPMIALLLEHGASPELPIFQGGPLPLHYAASHALAGPAALLARSGANPFAVDSGGLSALDHALTLPDFKKAILICSLFPPPISRTRLELLLARLPQDDQALLSWLDKTWSADPNF